MIVAAWGPKPRASRPLPAFEPPSPGELFDDQSVCHPISCSRNLNAYTRLPVHIRRLGTNAKTSTHSRRKV